MPAALEPPFFRRGSENQCSSSHWSKTVPLFSYNRKNSGGRAQRQWQPPKPRIEANYPHSQPQPPRMPAALEPPFFRRGSENQCSSSHWSKTVPQFSYNRKNSGGRAQRQWQPPKPRIEANYPHSQPQPPRMPAALEPPFFRRGSENQCSSSHWSKTVPQLSYNRKNSGGMGQRQ